MQDTTNYQQAISDIYAPVEKYLQDQISNLGAQYEPQKASIEQAKVNAFRDIQKEAFKRGRFFGGFQPAEQARYLGEKYLPGLQQLTLAQESAKQGLLGKLVDIQSKKGSDVLSYLERRRQENIAAENQKALFAQQERLALLNRPPAPVVPTKQQFLVDAFSGYKPSTDIGHAEQVIQALMANYNMTEQQAADMVYPYRKKVFGQ